MKTLLFIILLIPTFGMAQEGGIRSLKTKSAKVTFLDLAGDGNKLIGIDNTGKAKNISVDGVTITLENDTLKASPQYTLPTASTTVLGGVKIDGTSITISEGIISAETQSDITTGTLSGTNVTWDYSVKKNYKIALTGNTVITLTNVSDGSSGTLWVTNAASTYTITFAGYSNSIDPFIRLASNMVITSGGGKFDDYTFKYNGSKMNWNGTLDRH